MKENLKNYVIFYLIIACLALFLGVYNKTLDIKSEKDKVIYENLK